MTKEKREQGKLKIQLLFGWENYLVRWLYKTSFLQYLQIPHIVIEIFHETHLIREGKRTKNWEKTNMSEPTIYHHSKLSINGEKCKERSSRCPSSTINKLWNFLFPPEFSLSLLHWGIKVKIHIFPSISLPFGNQTKEISNMFFSFLFSLPTSKQTRGKHFSFPTLFFLPPPTTIKHSVSLKNNQV